MRLNGLFETHCGFKNGIILVNIQIKENIDIWKRHFKLNMYIIKRNGVYAVSCLGSGLCW